MFEPKIPAIGASIGFALSLLIGVFSGASFGVVLARAVIMGIFFCFLTFLSKSIIYRFIPELLTGQAADSSIAAETGNAVDITIGDFDKDDSLFETPARDSTGNSMVPDFLDSGVTSGSNSSFQSVEVKENDLLSGTPEKDRQNESAQVKKAVETKTDNSRSIGGLDVLPDLEDFVPKPNENPENEDFESSVSSGSGTGNSLFTGSDTTGSSAEAETMVKAIRTILAKDS